MVGFEQVLGISLAGAMLSALYLRFGFWASVGCHLAWNTLAPIYKAMVPKDDINFIANFEGSYSTSFVLLVTLLLLFFIKGKSREA